MTVAYAGHILEEYVLDWRKWAQETSKLKLEWAEFFVANFAVIVLGICCSVVGFDCPVFSYMFVGLAAINAVFAHIGTTIIKKRFSPGFITSIFLFIPVCTWACRDTELAKDVMQNTWIAVYKHSHTYNSNKSNAKTWLSIIAKNEMLDLLKRA